MVTDERQRSETEILNILKLRGMFKELGVLMTWRTIALILALTYQRPLGCLTYHWRHIRGTDDSHFK